jgi:hypothetical protein
VHIDIIGKPPQDDISKDGRRKESIEKEEGKAEVTCLGKEENINLTGGGGREGERERGIKGTSEMDNHYHHFYDREYRQSKYIFRGLLSSRETPCGIYGMCLYCKTPPFPPIPQAFLIFALCDDMEWQVALSQKLKEEATHAYLLQHWRIVAQLAVTRTPSTRATFSSAPPAPSRFLSSQSFAPTPFGSSPCAPVEDW